MAYKSNERQAAAVRKHYELNRTKIKKRAKAFTYLARIRNKKFIDEYFSTHPCVDCGESDREVLTFDHVRGKKRGDVSVMAKDCAIETIIKEIEKCDVRCWNCHMRIEHKRRIRTVVSEKIVVEREIQLSLDLMYSPL